MCKGLNVMRIKGEIVEVRNLIGINVPSSVNYV
jgi:hypothetical protein